MCIHHIQSVRYPCGHSTDEVDEVEECEGLANGECSGITNEPLPSRQERLEDLCPDCRAKADKTTSPETEDTDRDGQEKAQMTLFTQLIAELETHRLSPHEAI